MKEQIIDVLKHFFKNEHIKVTRGKLSLAQLKDEDFNAYYVTLHELVTNLVQNNIKSVGIEVCNTLNADEISVEKVIEHTKNYFVTGFEHLYQQKIHNMCDSLFYALKQYNIVKVHELECSFVDKDEEGEDTYVVTYMVIGCTADNNIERIIYFNTDDIILLFNASVGDSSAVRELIAKLHKCITQDMYSDYNFLHTVLFPVSASLLANHNFIMTGNIDYNKRFVIYHQRGQIDVNTRLILGYSVSAYLPGYKGLLATLHTNIDGTEYKYDLVLRRLLTYIHKTYRNYCISNNIEKGTILNNDTIEYLSTCIINKIHSKAAEAKRLQIEEDRQNEQ